MTIQIGHKILLFDTEITPGEKISVNYLSERNLVLFFYPKDNTPGCTVENQEFAFFYKNFEKLNWQLLGCSRDTIKSHMRFKQKLGLPYELAADVGEHLCQAFNVVVEKNMYGKKVKGIERSTFLIRKGVLIDEWRKVKAKGHAQIVLKKINELSGK